VIARHPNNGPTFSKPTIKKQRPSTPSPDRQKAQLDEDARAAAKQRRFLTLLHNNPAAWFAEYFRKKDE